MSISEENLNERKIIPVTREADATELLTSKADANFSLDNITSYGLNTEQLKTLIDPKNIYVLQALGGIDPLLKCLNTDAEKGIVEEQLTQQELDHRTNKYGINKLPKAKQRGLIRIILQTLDDKVLIVLIIAAVISLALGLYETFGQPDHYNSMGQKLPKLDWVEGVAILVAVLVVTLTGSVTDWNKERQFARLNSQQSRRYVDVIRGGNKSTIDCEELLAGDVLIIKPGDIVSADGVLLECSGIECDESSVTGESDTLKKFNAKEAIANLENDEEEKKCDCFLISGAEVQQGSGKMLVTSVGVNSVWGATFASLQTGTEITPLQEKLNTIADGVARAGVWSALVLFLVLFIRFLVQISGHNALSGYDGSHKASKFMDIFIVSVTVVVVAVPEGLPLAVTLALGFATTKLVQENCLVRVLKSCETMGGATSICSDKTGTLTQNKMTVVRSVLGSKPWEIDLSAMKDDDEEDESNNNSNNDDEKETANVSGDNNLSREFADTPFELLIKNLIVLNSTVEEEEENPARLTGSKTEIALINYARNFFGVKVGQLEDIRKEGQITHALPFHSARKFMATVIQTGDKKYRILYKGAAEILTNLASLYLTSPDGETAEITEDIQAKFNDLINGYADDALRCISVAYKDVESDNTPCWDDNDPNWLNGEGLIFVGLFGIQDPLRRGVKEAVQTCQNAGVTVRMLTGDNLRTAKAISKNAGILPELDDGSIALEGPEFRKIDNPTLRGMAPQIKVIARCSPQDKRRFVEFLRYNGETVAVTGDGTNDAPALRLADVGFAMGIAGTEIAKEAADFIIMDDNFATIVNAIKWGRSVNDTVRKYLQFQLTVNVCAVILTFITAVASSENEPALTAIQLLWVNLIMDTIAALAFSTDPPSTDILERKPDNRRDGLMSPTMWKMILGQTFFQLAVCLVLNFAGHSIFFHDIEHLSEYQERQIGAMVFNTFVWLQIFNIFGSRRLDNKINCLKNLHKNIYFPVLVAIIIGFQFIIIFLGGATFNVKPITGAMWGTSVICGLVSLPFGMLLKVIPDKYFMMIYPRRGWNYLLIGMNLVEKGLGYLFYPITFCVMGLIRLFSKKKAVQDDDESVASSVAVTDDQSETRVGFVDEVNHKLPKDEELVESTFIQRIRGGRVKQLRFLRRKNNPIRRLTRKASSFFSQRTRLSSFSFNRPDVK